VKGFIYNVLSMVEAAGVELREQVLAFGRRCLDPRGIATSASIIVLRLRAPLLGRPGPVFEDGLLVLGPHQLVDEDVVERARFTQCQRADQRAISVSLFDNLLAPIRRRRRASLSRYNVHAANASADSLGWRSHASTASVNRVPGQ
jgi:hypothetical protein